MSATILCHMVNDKPVATVMWDEPLPTGEHSLIVDTMLDKHGEEIDWRSRTIGDPNPLHEAVSIIAGPDAMGKWYTMPVGEQIIDH